MEQRVNLRQAARFPNWDALIQFIFEDPKEREKIGPAWLLFLDIVRNADQAGIYSTTYAKLAQVYNVAIITAKTWRHHLREQKVIESYSQGHSVAFRLLEPYLSLITSGIKSHPTENENEETRDLIVLKRLFVNAVKNHQLERAA